MTSTREESGFSILELIVAMSLLLVVSGIATTALLQMTSSQQTIWNRTQMHSGVRGATELLQQEVGQAGRISLPAAVTLTQTVNPVGGAAPAASAVCDPGTPTAPAVTVSVSSTAGIFAQPGPPAAYINLTTLDGDAQESFRVGAVDTGAGTITACFTNPHAAGTTLVPLGGFATGIIPNTGIIDGSSASVLKLYGDINGDGNMVYVEYTCDPLIPPNPPTNAFPGTGNLYRNVMAYDAGVKPPLANSQILLTNIIPNPGGTACFTYQTTNPPLVVQGTPFTFVLDVAITLTVQTEQIDPVTRQFQTETKALLNVSPRNIFNAWMLASIGYTDRIQSTPVSVTLLLP